MGRLRGNRYVTRDVLQHLVAFGLTDRSGTAAKSDHRKMSQECLHSGAVRTRRANDNLAATADPAKVGATSREERLVFHDDQSEQSGMPNQAGPVWMIINQPRPSSPS